MLLTIRFLVLTLILSTAAMLVAFLVVVALGGRLDSEAPPDPALAHRARMLRLFSNELVSYCNQYHRRVPPDPVEHTTVERRWVERTFRKDIQFLEQRMNDTILGPVPEYVRLKGAAARVAAMARNPGDRLLRERVLGEVAAAAGAVESYLARVDAGRLTGQPRIAPRF